MRTVNCSLLIKDRLRRFFYVSLVVVFHLSLFNTPLWAYDFSIKMPQGYSLYYNIYTDGENDYVELTYPAAEGMNYWVDHRMPWGDLVIPEEVMYDGIRFTVVSVADRAFSGCSELTSVSLPATLTNIGSYAFYQCTGLKGAVTIGESVTRIGRSAFYGCTNLTAVNFNAVNCETMGGSRSSTVFGNCQRLARVNFGKRVRRIPDYAFTGMYSLQSEWNLPEALEYVGEYAFAYCYNINGELQLPRSVRTVKEYAFAQCHGITGVVLSPSLVEVGSKAFYQCVKLRTVKAKSLVPPILGSDVFMGCAGGLKIEVPCISVDRYKAAGEWKDFGQLTKAQPCTIELVADVDNSDGGTVVGTGSYGVGDTAMLVVACYPGWGFFSWSDGVVDNPRTVVVNDTTTYMARLMKAEVVTEIVEVHDTVYMEGVDTVYEYYEVNDVAEPIGSQDEIVYNREKRRLEIPFDRRDIIEVVLYNDAGRCLMMGRPRHGRVKMNRYLSGNYVVRVSTVDDEYILRFFHNKK